MCSDLEILKCSIHNFSDMLRVIKYKLTRIIRYSKKSNVHLPSYCKIPTAYNTRKILYFKKAKRKGTYL